MSDDYFSEDTATFGDRIAAAREALGYSQNQLAVRLGVRVGTLQNWESDRSEPRANKLQMLAGLLNVSIVWLLTGQGDGVPAPSEVQPDAADMSMFDEMRDIRLAQIQLIERLARLEKRMRAARSEA